MGACCTLLMQVDAGTLVNTQPCGAQLSLHLARQERSILMLINFTWKNCTEAQNFLAFHSVLRLSFWCTEGTRSLEEFQGGALSLPGDPVPTRRELTARYCGEAPRPRQVPPGGSVELLHLLRQLLLEAPLLLVLLGVRELHHNR